MSSDVVAGTDGLFDASVVTTPSDDTMQWRAALLQLVNWGGFSGLTSVPLRGDTTMISGASGVGKSTILDAYTALMMPSDTKFNGASNDAVSGRARSVGQRATCSPTSGVRSTWSTTRRPGALWRSCCAAVAPTPGARWR
ncbi:ATP-binding protein [Nocardioides daphniae]|uniref:ATP-binding protein n=1 Tax=Nocardioides daphniae TaxID=402297 RepID=A0A4P7UBR8_9ACTN|nr:ATP-binding protein [Nocardioides daphniae]QCC77560.1 hypothetical protein E2C04_10935 [Nocardioides daphniae]